MLDQNLSAELVWEAVERFTGRQRPAVVTVPEFSHVLGISRVTGYRMAALAPENGGVQTVSLLGAKRIPTSEIFRLVGLISSEPDRARHQLLNADPKV